MSNPPFTNFASIAAPLPDDNIDTDIIFPARFLLITAKHGLGDYAFYDRRHGPDGARDPGHVLNQARFDTARVLVTGANFGCGSSREQAVWALAGLGIRAIIAPSFGEIFAGNALRNGVLPIVQPATIMAEMLRLAGEGAIFSVDLSAETLSVDGLPQVQFSIAAEAKAALLNGWDETDQIIHNFAADIAAFEQQQRATMPWLYRGNATQ